MLLDIHYLSITHTVSTAFKWKLSSSCIHGTGNFSPIRLHLLATPVVKHVHELNACAVAVELCRC